MILLLLLTILCSGSQASYDDYQLQVQPVVQAQEGVCVFVSCTFTYPKYRWLQYTTHGYWYRLPEKKYGIAKGDLVATNHQTKKVSPSTQGRFQLVGNPEDGNCSLLITDVQKRDSGVYHFRVESGKFVKYSYVKSKVSMEVTDLTQPDVYILEPLWPNHWGTIICVFNATFEGCPAPSFYWEGSVLSSSLSQVNTHRSSVLKIAPRPQDQGTNLTCNVRFAPQGLVFQKTVRLDLAYAPQNLVIHVSLGEGAAPQSHSGTTQALHLQVQKGSFLQLLCEASSKPPASLSWARGDRVLSCSQSEDPKALALVLPSVLAGDAGSYTCRAENALGQEMRMIHLEVQYAPEDVNITVFIGNRTVLQTLRNATTLRVLQGQSLQMRCVAHSNPPAMLSWTQGSLVLNPMQPTEPGLLILPQIQPDQEGEFTCQAQNSLGSLSVSVQLCVQETPTTYRSESQGSRTLVLILIRATLMGTSFLLTYSLTWVYYSRCGRTQGRAQQPRATDMTEVGCTKCSREDCCLDLAESGQVRCGHSSQDYVH